MAPLYKLFPIIKDNTDGAERTETYRALRVVIAKRHEREYDDDVSVLLDNDMHNIIRDVIEKDGDMDPHSAEECHDVLMNCAAILTGGDANPRKRRRDDLSENGDDEAEEESDGTYDSDECTESEADSDEDVQPQEAPTGRGWCGTLSLVLLATLNLAASILVAVKVYNIDVQATVNTTAMHIIEAMDTIGLKP